MYGEPKYVILMLVEILVAYFGALLIDKYKNEKTTFAFNSFKIQLHKEINNYKYMYPKYLNYLYEFMNVINITNKDVFIQEFKTKINDCDDLFVLYLFHITLKDD